MAKEKMITVTQLKKALSGYSAGELVTLITEIFAASSQTKEYLTLKFAAEDSIEDVLERYKKKITNEFFPDRGLGRLDLQAAKKAMADFKKICKDKAMVIDIMLCYVENGVEFINNFGDIKASFYSSGYSVFRDVVGEINSGDKELYDRFAQRLRWVAESASAGYGFYDDMQDLYYEIYWLEEHEEEV
jgi:hypothetical protein